MDYSLRPRVGITRDQLEGRMRTELLTALQPAFAKIGEKGVRYSALPGHAAEIAEALNEALSAKWTDLRGIEIVSFGVSSVPPNPEDEAMVKELQKNAVFRNANMAAVNKGKFCAECGARRPAGAPLYQCDKCGWKPADPTRPPKFCPECGDVFDESDAVR